MNLERDNCYDDNYDDNDYNDYNDDMNDDFNDDMNDNSGPPSMPPNRFNNKRGMNFQRNNQYNNAYGNYRGGYGPPGGFGNNWRGPPPNYGPPDNFGPPPPLFPSCPPGGPGPAGPSGPSGFMWGRGFGPSGPPVKRQSFEDKTIRYLMRCGVHKDTLKNLPKDLLDLYEPEYCGLCAHSFDTFAVSRMHYISKNHLKNQKKWLTQQSDAGFRRNKEIPLKSRDLYCELCDVHITSKIHSDSHYSGKPHRAIVDGRKNPRNPFLLQRGMENRVEQLIRRERKFLKSSENDDEVEIVAETKPNQPELYCDICKTSVTCSEQMTMHLNGKRHLAKEKHHIFSMMKGDRNKDDRRKRKETPSAQEVPTEGGDFENQNATEGDDEINDDWANGSGTWDEPAKTD